VVDRGGLGNVAGLFFCFCSYNDRLRGFYRCLSLAHMGMSKEVGICMGKADLCRDP